MAKADGSRTPTGFDRLIFTHAALKPLEIRQYSLRALPCLSKNQLCQNCKAPVSRQFYGILDTGLTQYMHRAHGERRFYGLVSRCSTGLPQYMYRMERKMENLVMATILWVAWIVLIFFSDLFYEIMSPGMYSVISVAGLVCAIVSTVQGKKKKKQQKTVENEKRAAAYVPPTGSVAAEIRAAVPPPPTAQELDQRHRRDMEARVNSIIEECKAAAQAGKRKIYVTVESYESFSDKKECEYDINCPEKEKELYDELVKRGFFVALPNV